MYLLLGLMFFTFSFSLTAQNKSSKMPVDIPKTLEEVPTGTIKDFLLIDESAFKDEKVDKKKLAKSSYMLLSLPYASKSSSQYYPISSSENKVKLGSINIYRGMLFKYSLPVATIKKIVLKTRPNYVVSFYEESKNLKYPSKQIKINGLNSRLFELEYDFNGYLLGVYNNGIELASVGFKNLLTGKETIVPLYLGLGDKPDWHKEIESRDLLYYITSNVEDYFYMLNAVKTAISSGGFYNKIFKTLDVVASKNGYISLSAKLNNYTASNSNVFIPSAYALSLGIDKPILSGVYKVSPTGEERANYPLIIPTGPASNEVLGILQQSTTTQVYSAYFVIKTR